MGLKEQIRRFRAWQKEAVHYSDEHLEPHHCPNCGHDFEGNYCPVCRQGAGDGRITWKWVYKCVMEVWGMESLSLPYTVLQLIFRPGYLISDYINGRRQTSYTPVNMLFIIALVYVIVAQLLGIGGVVTYKNSPLPETLKNVPLEHIVLETDSPYLAPVPYRGKRNESRFMTYVMDALGEVYGVSPEDIDRITTANAKTLFNLPE